MRVMMMVKGDPAADQMPTEEMLAEMGRYNEELARAGVMLEGAGLHPSAEGVRVAFSGSTRTVTDGPFAETKELIAGYWILQVKSMEEAIQWAKRVPFEDGEVEIRQLFELDEFGDSPAIDRARKLEQELKKNRG